MGFRDGRGEEGRYPIIPGTFAKKNSDGELQATPLGELYVASKARSRARKQRSMRSKTSLRKSKV